jgi:hypothetical protein
MFPAGGAVVLDDSGYLGREELHHRRVAYISFQFSAFPWKTARRWAFTTGISMAFDC